MKKITWKESKEHSIYRWRMDGVRQLKFRAIIFLISATIYLILGSLWTHSLFQFFGQAGILFVIGVSFISNWYFRNYSTRTVILTKGRIKLYSAFFAWSCSYRHIKTTNISIWKTEKSNGEELILVTTSGEHVFIDIPDNFIPETLNRITGRTSGQSLS